MILPNGLRIPLLTAQRHVIQITSSGNFAHARGRDKLAMAFGGRLGRAAMAIRLGQA
jgi:hypothetical protein